MSASPINLGEALRDYRRLRRAVPVGPLRSKKDYERAVRALDAVLDAIGDNERHPLADLAETIGMFVERYEQEHLRVPEAAPADVLRFLMEQHNLRQSDLKEIGSQGVVSEILSGRRRLNTRQINRLAARFKVSPAVFL
jgi:HTH-type transcriptional regulator/antitoxin HigA